MAARELHAAREQKKKKICWLVHGAMRLIVVCIVIVYGFGGGAIGCAIHYRI